MPVKNCVNLDYTALCPAGDLPKCQPGEILQKQTQLSEDWGQAQINSFELPHARLYEVKALVRKNLHIAHREDRECSTINSCFSLSGEVTSKFYGIPQELSLADGTQNFMYKPVLSDSHYVAASNDIFQLFHVEVDVNYYSRLLNLNERWADVLREKLFKKQIVSGSPCMMAITNNMYKSINEILNCSLSGPLRQLMFEAKVLELLAYQLDQFRSTGADMRASTVNKGEKEKFYELKAYLDKHYNGEHTLRSLSRAYGLNEFKLKKGFKDLFGNTVFGYIHELKMKEAKMLMEECGFNVSEVAARAGYKNANHFSVAFKKQFGLSPSVVRRSSLENVALHF